METSECDTNSDVSEEKVKSRSGKRPKKARFHGNQTVTSTGKKNEPTNDPQPSTSQSASFKKLADVSEEVTVDTEWAGYRVVDRNIMFGALKEFCSCKKCGGEIEITDENTGGLSCSFTITCKSCYTVGVFDNSKKIGPKKNLSEINRRSVFAIRALGQGYAGLSKFCSHMELDPPVGPNTFNMILKSVHEAVVIEGEKTMLKAGKEESEATQCDDIEISGDGSWQRRGHRSLNGVCTVIGLETGKVIDVEVMSKLCLGCARYSGPKDTPEYEDWWKKHEPQCQQNYSGSAAKMEADGMVRIFSRSQERRGLRYVVYLGDQDSKTFKSIAEYNPYDAEISKKECTGHIQKKMGRWLRKLKVSMKGQKLEDGKMLFGKGRLTDKVIDKIQTYYGNAIRNNSESVEGMQNSIWAIFYHMQATDRCANHSFCPTGGDSWCKYQVAVSLGTQDEFHHKTPELAPVCMDTCKTVFEELSKPDLLQRCLGAHTQNPNESINNLIWKYAPKENICGRRVVEIATNLAVLDFNGGQKSKLGIMEHLELTVGRFFMEWAEKVDSERVSKADVRAQKNTKQVRQSKRLVENIKQSRLKEEEGLYYEPGSF